MDRTALEQSFADICERHGLTCLMVNYSNEAELQFAAYAHWTGFATDGNACEHGFGGTLQAAIHNCLERAAVKRAPAPFYPQLDHDESLPVEAL